MDNDAIDGSILGAPMLVGFRDSQRFVYHYTKPATGLSIVMTNTLRMGCYRNTNDPKETKDWRFRLFTPTNGDLDTHDLEHLSAVVSAELKDSTYVLCFSTDQPLSGDHTCDIYQRGFCRSRMWAQYADDHRGMCLIFDRDDLRKAIRAAVSGATLGEGPVHYINRPFVDDLHDPTYAIDVNAFSRLGARFYGMHHFRSNYQRLFFEKCSDWRDEHEYRYVAYGTPDTPMVEFGSALRGVVFGASCDAQVMAQIVALRKEKQTWYEQLVWRGCTPWVTFKLRWP